MKRRPRLLRVDAACECEAKVQVLITEDERRRYMGDPPERPVQRVGCVRCSKLVTISAGAFQRAA